ncbi:Alpha/beta-Hydrolases superfamily protein [Hibiscus syriacus]|uniref:Phospholipase A1 n=1 Tax=Hibiscus syriacus TaxID=106335 RepID=A0A6A3BVG8_HIBSY|nr:phospholipase A1-II 1-like [Hibiscus syriacus]KAE8720850.1 Alpha/beta-Hydrolases superfamily protein [Hibiscus syriacus]
MCGSIASRWRVLSGENNWEGLLEPLDPDLRRYIIHYGQMTAAIEDLFNKKKKAADATEEEFFTKACLVKGNLYEYDVDRFIYAGTRVVPSSWFGYVAVATDEGKRALGRRDILIAWRGTKTNWELINDCIINHTSGTDIFPTAKEHGAKLHRGFHSLYTGTRTRCETSARQQVLDAVEELVKKYENEETSITVTGFSLGAALATLTAMDIVANGYNKPTTGNKPCMVTAFTYGGPHIGNVNLKKIFGTLGKHHHLLRIKNKKDPVTKLPPGSKTYFGNKLVVDSSMSNYLKGLISPPTPSMKSVGSPFLSCINGVGTKRKRSDSHIVPLDDKLKAKRICEDEDQDESQPIPDESNSRHKRKRSIPEILFSTHSMDLYMHGVAIKDIENNASKLLDHDIALVNKHSGRLKKEYKIPSKWWFGKNRKKMVQLENGRWKVQKQQTFR